MAPMGLRRDTLALIQGRIPVLRLVPDSVEVGLQDQTAIQVAATQAQARPAVSPLLPPRTSVVAHMVAAAAQAVAHSAAVAAALAVDSVEAVTSVAAVAAEAEAAGSLSA